MFGSIRRIILSGIDVQRGILDYAEQMIERDPGGEAGETPLGHLRAKFGDDLQHLREVVHDVVKNTLQTGLHQIDDKLDALNEHIAALDKKKTDTEAPRQTKTRKAAAKKRKPAPKKPTPVADDEPIIDG